MLTSAKRGLIIFVVTSVPIIFSFQNCGGKFQPTAEGYPTNSSPGASIDAGSDQLAQVPSAADIPVYSLGNPA